jgi:hypothetical protein
VNDTTEYDRVQSIEVSAQPTGVTVTLRAKPGEAIHVADIEKCLKDTRPSRPVRELVRRLCVELTNDVRHWC